MRAAYYERNGSAREVLVLGEVDTPMPGPGEVRVRLRASGVNPSDVKSRLGNIMKMRFPRVIPHSDGAGEIDLAGEGVNKNRVGERVWVWNAQWMRPFGTAAEYVVLPAAQAVLLPPHIDYTAGACLGIPALTAFHAVTMNGAVAGKTLLISGGAGAVSHYAIQIAKALGATVITTVSSREKAALAISAGADVAIDYKTQDVVASVKASTDDRGVDLVIELDLAANAHLLSGILRPKGRVVAYGTSDLVATIPAVFLLLNSISIDFFLVYTLEEHERSAAIEGISQMLERRQLNHNIGAVLELEQIVACHELIESGRAVGNVVIQIGES